MQIDVQVAISDVAKDQLPETGDLQCWSNAAITHASPVPAETQMTVRMVDETEIIQLNEQYRKKTGATNVLSFPFEALPGMPAELQKATLGDVVICAAVVLREAMEQGKPATAHWAHMVVHGTLHLLGYDHLDDDEAIHMETLEIEVLAALGYPNPYQSAHENLQHNQR